MITLPECRAAARAAREAEFGRAAIDAARPRGVLGIVRDRGPVAIMLYVAAREGRLVWQNRNGFAVIEPPSSARGPLLAGGARLTVLRVLDRHWQTLVFTLPAVLVEAIAAALLLVRPLWMLAAVLALLGLGYVAVLMITQLLWAARWLYRLGDRGVPTDRTAAESLPGSHWHVPLCHQVDSERAEEVLRETSARLIRLVSGRINAAAGELGGRARDVEVTETLVWLTGGVSTSPMRAAVEAAAGVLRPYGPGAEVVIMTLPDTKEIPRRRPIDRGGFLFWYLVGLATIVAGNAYLVAGWEECSYGAALRWLAGRLIFSDFSALGPLTIQSWVVGGLVSVAGLMTIPVAVFAGRRFGAALSHANTTLVEGVREVVTQTKVLILVVKQVERNAVLAAVRAVTGEAARPDLRGPHTVFALGSVGGANILLAQSGEQGMAGPAGMMLAATDLIRACEPDYVILTGICYGLWEEEQELGDILVSQRVHHLDHQARIGEDTVYRGQNVSPSPTLLDRFNAATVDHPVPPSIHFGLMLASDTVFNSREHRRVIKAEHPYAMGGDMEGAAVYGAAAKQKVDWIVVKGISDWGMDMAWPSGFQAKAARHAAEFVVHTIRLGSLREPPAAGSKQGRSA